MRLSQVTFRRLPTVLVLMLMIGPVLAGLTGTVLPALGYLPALGGFALSPEPLQAVLSAPGIGRSIALSFATGLAATAVSLALVLLFTASWLETPVFRRFARFLSPLLSVPHAAAAFGLAFLIAPSGFLLRLLSPWATGLERPPDILILHDPFGLTMTAGLIAKEVPFLFLMTLAALPQSDARRLLRVAVNLGYGRIAGFFKVVLPQIYPQIRLPVLAVLAYSTSVVDVAEILGPTTPPPLASRIIDWMADPEPAMRFQASAGALLQLLVSVFAILVWWIGERCLGSIMKLSRVSGRRARQDASLRHVSLILMASLIAAMLGGLLVLALWSVTKSWWFPDPFPTGFTLTRWMHISTMAQRELCSTLLLAIPATALSAGLTIWLLESATRARRSGSSRLGNLIFLPLLVPQVAFLFGLQILFLVVGLDGTYVAVGFAHVVFVLPYVYLALSDPWRHLDPRYARVAASLGASDNRIFLTVRLPLLLRPLMVTLAIGFSVSIGQYLPTLMIGAGRIATVTTESVALASGGNRSLIAVYAMLQLLLPLAGFLLAALIPAIAFRQRSALRPTR